MYENLHKSFVVWNILYVKGLVKSTPGTSELGLGIYCILTLSLFRMIANL